MNIEQIEKQLYLALVPNAPQVKVAMLIFRAFKGLDIPQDQVVNAALNKLAQRPDVETFGNVHQWRHSELKRCRS